MARRQEQVEQEIAHLAADFFARESDTGALVTVTRAEISENYRDARILLSVLPHAHEKRVLTAAKRQRSDFRAYIEKRSVLHPTPIVDFEIDYGEKNRQRVDELTRKKK